MKDKIIKNNILLKILTIFVLLQPFLPETAEKIFEQLNTNNKSIESINFDGLEDHTKLNQPEPLFVRINKEEKMQEINKDNE